MPSTPSLDGIPLFERLSPDERDELAEIMSPASFAAGASIYEEGGPEETLYVVTSGAVEVHKKILPGRRHHLAAIQAPAVIGEMGLLTEPRAAASVTARTPVEAQGIARDQFLEMLDEDSLAACKVIYEIGRTLAERMARTDESIAGIISQLERRNARGGHDPDVFGDRLLNEWGF
ncbi:MAG: cyclic nucleotide-binding domain-containing protein [Rubrobacteraceae bacterium]